MNHASTSSLRDVSAALGVPDAERVWGAEWAQSEAACMAGDVALVDRDVIDEACHKLNLSEEPRNALLRAAAAIEKNAALARLARHCHWVIFHSGRQDAAMVSSWAPMPGPLGEAGRLFYAIVVLSGLGIRERRDAERGIPPSITRDTFSDVEIGLADHHRQFGTWGFRKMGWLVIHCLGRLYRLGRLQFEIAVNQDDFLVLRHRVTREVVVLATGGVFDEQGQFAADASGALSTWTAEFTRRDGILRAHPISPRGFAIRKPAELVVDEWSVALERGDPVLSVHIPASGPMDHAACGASFDAATRFFPRHFPEHGFRAFVSGSWLFDDQLGDWLPASSNIVRFQREFHLLPRRGTSDFQIFERVFGGRVENPDAAPQDTALRRAVIQHMKAGGVWRTTNMLLLRDDLQWGKQVYRRVKT